MATQKLNLKLLTGTKQGQKVLMLFGAVVAAGVILRFVLPQANLIPATMLFLTGAVAAVVAGMHLERLQSAPTGSLTPTETKPKPPASGGGYTVTNPPPQGRGKR